MLPKNRIFLEHHVVLVCQNVWVEKSKEHKIPHILSRRSVSYSTGKSSKSWLTFWNFFEKYVFFSKLENFEKHQKKIQMIFNWILM